MKSLTKLMAMGLLSVGLAACSSDDEALPQGGQTLNGQEKVYMSLNLSFPTSRTATGSTTEEIGQPGENKVQKLQVLLKKADGTQAIGTAEAQELIGTNTAYTAIFDANQLVNLAGQQVSVYVACNKVNAFSASYDVNEGLVGVDYPSIDGIWAPNSFLMTNASVASTTLPSADVIKTQHTDAAHPVDLGTINVERAAARFDYKETVSDNAYTVKDGVNVTMEKVAFLNINKDQYYFRHVSETGNWTSPASKILVPETTTNYIVDWDWAWKAANDYTDVADHMLLPIGAVDKDKTLAEGSQVLLASGLTTLTNPASVDYKIAGYASENTIGVLDAPETAKKGQVTVAAFKGKLVAAESVEQNLKDMINGTGAYTADHPAVYAFGNTIYGTWANVKAAAAEPDAPISLKAAYDAAAAAAVAAGLGEPKAEDATKQKFTIYTWHDGGYAVYYYYYNLHNDLGDAADALTSPMRYGTVRNNVYKLSISTVSKYGHPFESTNDPDPVDPTDPIVTSELYFQVSVNVLPWTVRVNDIEF